MTIIVPKSVNVKGLVSSLNLTGTKSKHLKYKTYYFLSKIVVHNGNVELYEDSNFYRSVWSDTMKRILGNRYYYKVLSLLTNSDDPIIECNESYFVGSYCKKYRLTQKYNTGEIDYKELPKKFSERIHKLTSKEESTDLKLKYDFLIKQYKNYNLTLSNTVYEYVTNFYIELLKQVEKNNEYQIQMIQNLVGRWLYNIEKMNSGIYNPNVATTNRRLNSLFTSLPKVLRNFVVCNGKTLYSIDISASQSYLLATIMNNEFLLKNETEGYNLFTIFPELYREVIEKYKSINKENNIEFKYNKESKLNNKSNNKTYIINGSPLMWCQFFRLLNNEEIERFKQVPFHEDYYRYVLRAGLPVNTTENEINEEREKFKKRMMLILFDDNINVRKNNPYFRLMKNVFPKVNDWIETTLKLIGSKNFALLLQRTESYLLLNHVSRIFHQLNPSIPLFTIHDGLYTYKEYLPDFTSLIVEGLTEITGIIPGTKIESPRTNVYPLCEDVEEKWSKIKKIKTEKDFEKERGGVFSSNIQRAIVFFQESNLQGE